MKKTLIILFTAVLVLLAAMALSTPSEQAHHDAISKAIKDKLTETLGGEKSMVNGLVSKAVNTSTIDKIMDSALDYGVEYHNYIFWSTTTMGLLGEPETVSVGVLGMVFTLDDDK